MIGDILSNRYRLVRDLGRGHLTRAYIAEDINKGHLVVLKTLLPDLAEEEAYLHRFFRTAKLAQRLDSPHIAALLDYGTDQQTPYLIMAYVEGQTLAQVLQAQGKLPWSKALQYLDGLCQALNEGQQYGLGHGNLTSQNVMLTEKNQFILLDFGLQSPRPLALQTSSGFLGSPAYLAPEQILGLKIDQRADLYMAGVLFYEMIQGQLPFAGSTATETLNQHLTKFPSPLTLNDQFEGRNQALAEALHTFLDRLLAKRAVDRFQTPTQVQEVIQKLLSTHPIQDTWSSNQDASIASADQGYREAEQAIADQAWLKALDLLYQVHHHNRHHAEVKPQLGHVGPLARQQALSQVASQALAKNDWPEAIDALNEYLTLVPNDNHSRRQLALAKVQLRQLKEVKRLRKAYQQAIVCLQTGQYAQVETTLRQLKFQIVQETSKAQSQDLLTPQHIDDLLRQAKKRQPQPVEQRSKRRFNNILPKRLKLNFTQLPWFAVTVLLALVILGSVLLVNQTIPAPPIEAVSPSLIPQIEQAIQGKKFALAQTLIDQALDQNPNQEAVHVLQVHLKRQHYVAQQVAIARSALESQAWTQALDTLLPLQADPDFSHPNVTLLSCEAYLARGQERVADLTYVQDLATMQAAISDFQVGQQLCPTRLDIKTQITMATAYIQSLEADLSLNNKLEILLKITRDDPSYANGQAMQSLYQTYLNRGDALRRSGQLHLALTDYERAAALPVVDKSEAELSQAETYQALIAPTPTATAVIQRPPTAAYPLPQGAQVRPPLPPQRRTRSHRERGSDQYPYPAPRLLGPAVGVQFEGQFTAIYLSWEPVGILAEDEYYDVTIRYFVGSEARYWGSGIHKETRWRVPVEAGYGVAGGDEFTWWVTVRRDEPSPLHENVHVPLSEPSETRIFYWRRERR